MSDVGEAFVRVRFDDDQATRDLDRTVRRAVNDVERTQTTARPSRPGQRASRAGVIADEMRDLANTAPVASRALAAIEGAGGATAAGLGAATGVAAGAVGYLALINRSVDAYVNLSAQVRTFTERSGAAAEEASRFVAIADDYSIGTNTMANSMFFLSRAVATNEDGLTKLGVSVARNKDGSANLAQTLVNVANAYAGTNDHAQRAAIIQGALGRQGRELIPILEQGGAALERMLATVPGGQILSQRDLDRAREFQLMTDDLSDAFMEIAVAVGREVTPEITAMAAGLADAVRGANELLEPIGGIGRILARLPDLIPGIGPILGAARAWGRYKRDAEDAAEATEEVGSAANEAAQDLDAMFAAQVKAIEAELRVTSANSALEDSIDSVAEAARNYDEALRRTGEFAEADRRATERLASAKERLAQANRSVRDATEEVADKTDAVAAAEFRFGIQSREAVAARRELRDANEALQDAHGTVRDAQGEIVDSQRSLDEALRRGGPGSREAAEAARDLRRAQDDQKEAALKAAQAQVQYAIDTAEAKGQTFETTQQAELFRRKLEEIAATLAPDSPLRRYLLETAATLGTLGEAMAALGIGGGDWGVPTTGAQMQGPGAVTPGALGPGATGARDLSGGGAYGAQDTGGRGTVTIQELNVNNGVDARQVAYQIAWEAGGSR